jgi:hypothetical protein
MKKQPVKKVIKKKLPPNLTQGLEQTFENKNGKTIKLSDFLNEHDWWELKKGSNVMSIVLHDAVKKIADAAGILTDVGYSVLTQPAIDNNYQQTWQVRIVDSKGRATTEVGEVSRSNIGAKGRNNPANMAQKRAYDRAVFRHLGITGLLGEDELSDDEEDTKLMDKISHEERKALVPFINRIAAAKSYADLRTISTKLKAITTFTDNQKEVLRTVWKNQAKQFITDPC